MRVHAASLQRFGFIDELQPPEKTISSTHLKRNKVGLSIRALFFFFFYEVRAKMAVMSADILKQRKRINRKLTQAANGNATAVLDLVSEELALMNGVNMATALHRVARHSVGA